MSPSPFSGQTPWPSALTWMSAKGTNGTYTSTCGLATLSKTRDDPVVASVGYPLEYPIHALATSAFSVAVKGILLQHPKLVSLADRNNITPLHLAVWAGSTEMVMMLLLMGAQPDKADACGNTPVRIAEAHGDNSIAEILRAFGKGYVPQPAVTIPASTPAPQTTPSTTSTTNKSARQSTTPTEFVFLPNCTLQEQR